MAQRIYLSRHGRTEQNILAERGIRWWADPKQSKNRSIWSLTEEGKTVQPHTLGDYLQRFIIRERAPDRFIISTAYLFRNIQTSVAVADQAGIPHSNIHWYREFNEAVERELLPEDYDSQPEHVREIIDVSERSADIAQRVDTALRNVVGEFPENDIIAVLNGRTNINFLKSIGYNISSFDNCGLVTLEYDKGIFRVTEPHRTNEQLRTALSYVPEGKEAAELLGL